MTSVGLADSLIDLAAAPPPPGSATGYRYCGGQVQLLCRYSYFGGQVQLLPRLRVRLEAPLSRGGGRPELARAELVVGAQGELLARVSGSQASARIGSLQRADLLLEIPAELEALEAGQELWAQLLRLPIF